MSTQKKPFSAAEIRSAFLDYFAGQGHAVVASSRLVPGNDPTLLGQTLYGRFYIADPGAANSLAITQAFQITVFGDADLIFRTGFE